MRQVQFEGMTDSEKNDFINFIYGQLKDRGDRYCFAE